MMTMNMKFIPCVVCFLILMSNVGCKKAELKRNQDYGLPVSVIKDIAKGVISNFGECMMKDEWYNSMIDDCEKCDVATCETIHDDTCYVQCKGAFDKITSRNWNIGLLVLSLFTIGWVVALSLCIAKQNRERQTVLKKLDEMDNQESQQHPDGDRHGGTTELEGVPLVGSDGRSLSSDSGTELSRDALNSNRRGRTFPVQETGVDV